MTKIIVNSIHKKFKSHQVLKGLSFTCEDEILFIAGKNGAGKTTFIRLALGMDSLDKGKINFENAENSTTKDMKIGSVFDTPCLFMEMSGQQNINIFCAGFLHDRAYIKQIKESLNIDDRFLKQKAGKYSFGQQHRLNVAIALIRKPQFLFLDEPTIGLDPDSWDLVKESVLLNQRRQKGCVIITGQDYFEMGKFANKLLVLDEGISKYFGTPEDFLNKFPKEIVLKTNTDSLPDFLIKYIAKVEEDENGNFIYQLKTGQQTDEIFALIKNSDMVITQLSITEINLKEAFTRTIRKN